MTNQDKVTELADWAAEAGDPDVLLTCQRALAGDGTAEKEALEWWGEWSRPYQRQDLPVFCFACGRQKYGEGHVCPEEST